MANNRVTIMGSYVADVAFRIDRLPTWGETRMGQFFQLGPGGKGSNQAVAAARAGANVAFISKLGPDPFGDMARTMYRKEGIDTQYIFASPNPTGAAAILIDAARGENAIVIVPGACFELTPAEIDQATALIASSSIFVAQLELPILTVEHGLRLAHTNGVLTILNPAPAATLPAAIYPLCDYLTPNETEATALTGIPVSDLASAEEAASFLLALGVRNVILTLGAQGALIKTPTLTRHIPAVNAGPVVETTGAGDAFNGGLATALAEGMNLPEATQFACAVAGISVTRPGTAPSMPHRSEIDAIRVSA
ncbi:MAG TPA: ribokinase [Edaphobacter sp.]|jgi:ribokinase|nr:ribokinase [Edaphobacter sp.]